MHLSTVTLLHFIFQAGVFFECNETYVPDEQLIATMVDLFSAGSETTSTTLAWAVLYLILYPDIQERVHREIDEVLGDREPSMEDKDRFGKLLVEK